VARGFRPGDLVLSYPNEGDLPFRFAVRDLGAALPSRAVPAPVPAFSWPGGWHPTGSNGVLSLRRPELRAIARAPEVARAPTVWLLRLGPWAYDKGDVLVDELRRDGRRQVAQWRRGPIDLIALRRCGPPAVACAAPAGR
jgi:mannosyltransferase